MLNETVSETVGKDFFSCTNGDSFGNNSNSLSQDILFSGYNDGECVVNQQSSYVKISYKRLVSTSDEFDLPIYEDNNQICILVGTSSRCETITPETLYPIMNV